MKVFLAILLITVSCLALVHGETWSPAIEQANSFGRLPKINDQGTSEWFNKRMVEFSKLSNMSNFDKIKELGYTLNQGTIRPIGNPEAASVFMEAQRLMMNCDHPAETLAEWLEEQRALRIKQTEEDSQGIRRHDKDSDYQPSFVFCTIAQIHTPESVEVLGRYLSDKRDEKDMKEFGGFSGGHFRYAAQAFNDMGIKNAPTRKAGFSTADDYIQKWQQWYAEVEAGTRSFSFYGSDTVYWLKDRTDAKGRDHAKSSTEERESANKQASSQDKNSTPGLDSSGWKTIAFAIATLLLLIGSLLALRKRHELKE